MLSQQRADAGEGEGTVAARRRPSEWQLRRDRVIPPDVVRQKLLPAAKAYHDPLAYMLISLCANCGGRISEVLSLKASSLNATDPVLTINTLKRPGHPPREIYLPESVAATIRSWITRNELGPDDYLFPSPKDKSRHLTRQWAGILFNRIALTAGVKVWGRGGRSGVGIHGLRHANAVSLMEEARHRRDMGPLDALELIKRRLGHSSLKSTLVYLHYTREKDVIKGMKPFE